MTRINSFQLFYRQLFVVLSLAVFFPGCAGLNPALSGTSVSTAVVTGISNGRASIPDEKMYGLRIPSGRVYFVTQSLKKQLKEGDTVEIEVGNGRSPRIREK